MAHRFGFVSVWVMRIPASIAWGFVYASMRFTLGWEWIDRISIGFK